MASENGLDKLIEDMETDCTVSIIQSLFASLKLLSYRDFSRAEVHDAMRWLQKTDIFGEFVSKMCDAHGINRVSKTTARRPQSLN